MRTPQTFKKSTTNGAQAAAGVAVNVLYTFVCAHVLVRTSQAHAFLVRWPFVAGVCYLHKSLFSF